MQVTDPTILAKLPRIERGASGLVRKAGASTPKPRSGTRLRPVSARIAVKSRRTRRVPWEPLVAWALAATAVVLASLIAGT